MDQEEGTGLRSDRKWLDGNKVSSRGSAWARPRMAGQARPLRTHKDIQYLTPQSRFERSAGPAPSPA